MVENLCAKAVLSKPISVGCAILEFAKLVMYKFYYDCLLPTFGDRQRLCFTVCHVKSDDLVGELGAITDRWLDISNFERAHPLFSDANFKIYSIVEPVE